LWQDLAEYISVRPWQGYGFKAFWNPRHITDIALSQEWVISEAHSSYVDTTLQLGIVGTVLLSLAAISVFFYSAITFRKTLRPEYLFLVGGVFFCIVRGFTESGLNGSSPITAFLFLALTAHSWNGDRISTDSDHNISDHLS
jgi:O-antigen ligase